MSLVAEFVKGIYKENPVFRLALGLCPTLAVSTSISNAIGMGAATTFVLLGSNTMVSLIILLFAKILSEEGQKSINKIRIPVFIVVIASFVTIVEMIMSAYFPALSESLGIFIPLIVVNCIILGRAEAFASRNPVHLSAADGLSIGLGFTLSLTLVGSIREILGAGTWFGMQVMWDGFEPFKFMVQAPGAFVCLGILLGLMNFYSRKRGEIFIQT